jgi:GT2 family glycosyltransferase
VGPAPVVAVCTNRTPGAVAESLTALQAQVPADRIVLVTSGLSDHQIRGHQAAAAAITVVSEPRPGLSLARNRALEFAACQGAHAVAYVDDDAVVGPGWWDALAQRWAQADEQVGVIGGPIRPRWVVPPPAWISQPILPTLTVLDLGRDERELDPATTTVFGANISFAVAALQEVGGFDPAYGHSGGRVFFSEEDQVQRALASRGYRILYAPGMAVEHIIPAERMTRRSFVRRRYAYGKALGKRRGRTFGTAALQSLTSALGAPVALLLRNDKLFMERLVRAAENAGVLTGTVRRG